MLAARNHKSMRSIPLTIYLVLLVSSLVYSEDNLPTYIGEPLEADQLADYEEQLEVGCSLGCAIGWTIKTTSTLKASNGKPYKPSYLGDGKLHTAWIEGINGYGLGEKIIIRMQGDKSSRDISFRGIEITNGFAKSDKTWAENTRVKFFKVYHNDSQVFYIKLEDTKTPQHIEFPPIYVNHKDTIVLEIAEVYPGTKYKNTAISEIQLYGAH